jgi:hypothetical protein
MSGTESTKAGQGTLVALVGDSTLDNGSYVGDKPDVGAVLCELLPVGSDAVLLAIDGSLISDVPEQLRKLPQSATHIILSVGGNDALQMAALLERQIGSVSDALELVASAQQVFAHGYHPLLDDVLGHGLPTAICTIYEPAFPDARFRRAASAALTSLNDVILREAFTRRLPVIDLRLVCNSDHDFESTIEPSATGGAKIAGAIARLLSDASFAGKCSEVFGA